MQRVTINLEAVTAAEAAGDAVIAALQEAGCQAFRVGGCVRDRLLGRTPGEVDVATDAPPARVRELFPRTYAVGEQFGVIIVHMAGGTDIEVATFRQESGYADGRHPSQVRFSTAEQDALRRDFTVNALFYDPRRREILDYVDGWSDLHRGCLRAIGRATDRFREDHLRMLRAIRFAASLGFELTADTAMAVTGLAPAVTSVSAERIFSELNKMLLGPDPAGAFGLASDLGILPVVLPDVAAMVGVPQPPAFHPEGDVWQHTLLMLNKLRWRDDVLAWAALLHDVGKPPTHEFRDGRDRFPNHAGAGVEAAQRILRGLRAPGRLVEGVIACIGDHMTFIDVPNMRQSTLRRFMGRDYFGHSLELHRLDCLASHGKMDNFVFLLDNAAVWSREPVVPPALIRGHDVLNMGVAPGPLVGTVLAFVQDLQLNGEIETSSEAIAAALKFLRDRGAVMDGEEDRP